MKDWEGGARRDRLPDRSNVGRHNAIFRDAKSGQKRKNGEGGEEGRDNFLRAGGLTEGGEGKRSRTPLRDCCVPT